MSKPRGSEVLSGGIKMIIRYCVKMAPSHHLSNNFTRLARIDVEERKRGTIVRPSFLSPRFFALRRSDPSSRVSPPMLSPTSTYKALSTVRRGRCAQHSHCRRECSPESEGGGEGRLALRVKTRSLPPVIPFLTVAAFRAAVFAAGV